MPQDKAVVAFNLDLAPPPTSQLSKPPKTTPKIEFPKSHQVESLRPVLLRKINRFATS
jgi:hypothetical protein